MPAHRLRIDTEYLPLLARGMLLVVCSLATAVSALGPQVAIAPAILLLLVAALGSVPVPAGMPKGMQALAEVIGAAAVIGALHGKADLYLPYLLVPLVATGLSAGLLTSLVAAATASAVLVISTFAASAGAGSRPGTGWASAATWATSLTWVPMFLSVGLVSAWVRRVSRAPSRPSPDPAYADAHRLLSELHVVARQLSLGLDPQTLAAALVEELREIVGDPATVLVRSPGGRFVPLIGDHLDPFTESVVVDAWLAADLVRRSSRDTSVTALPVRMGVRVVAVVVIRGSDPPSEQQLDASRTVIGRAGTRLASALLFDDVRRLATVDERMRLAREIHDGIAQDMASVGYLLDDIARDADTEVAARLATLREHIGGLVSELRLSIFDLRAGVDESVGLSRTLADYVQRVGSQAGLVVHVSTDESPHRLPVATEVELLRIVQEAVTNVRRHAQASNLWLSVTVDPPMARVSVTDDGRGLQPKRADSMGITGMKERARRIGAQLRVEPARDGRGTMVEVLLNGQAAKPWTPPSAIEKTRSVADSAGAAVPTGAPVIDLTAAPGVASAQPRGAGRPWSRR